MSKPNLIHKTRGEKQSPQGKPKVFFTCAEEDFEKYFEKENKDILWSDENIDCAIWYNKDKDYQFDNDEEKEEYYSLLHDMNLFVMPVTLEFLKGNSRAYKVDFRYAIDNHIPILMIMEEQGLEAYFEAMCGKIQYLDRFQDTSTQETFEDKLKKFLNDTLISNELAQKIRDSFDAYIFLSYRKKDRKEALEVMKEIHSNDFMRDIAIWFDENLIPGENFSEAIKDALEKSELFTIVITPNLNEIPNYVMNEEYPSALKNKKQILPIMAKDTDKETLLNNYRSLPETIKITDKKIISDKLISLLHREAYKENDNPEHLYYIALAYLNGIDVEKDADKGIELLNKSAKLEYIPALEKLVNIYFNGEGTRINYEKAIEYQKKLIIVNETNHIDISILLKLQSKLAFLLLNYKNYGEALELSEKTYEKQKEILGEDHSDTIASLANLAYLYGIYGKYDKELELSKKVYEKRREILGEDHPDTLASLNNLSISYKNNGNNEKALEIRKKVYEKRKEILGEDHPDTLKSLHNLAMSYVLTVSSAEALEFNKGVSEKIKDVLSEYHPYTLASLNSLAHLYTKVDNYDKALDLYKTIYEKRKEILGEDHPDTLKSLSNIAISYEKIGNDEKALELYEEVYAKQKEALGRDDSTTINSLNKIFKLQVKVDKKHGEEELIVHRQEYINRKEKLGENNLDTIKSLSNLASSYRKIEDYDKELELNEKIYVKLKEILGENHPETLESLNNLAVSYNTIGKIGKALELYEKVYEKRKEILGEYHSDTIASLEIISYINYYNIQDFSTAKYLFKKLYEIQKDKYGDESKETKETLEMIRSCDERKE